MVNSPDLFESCPGSRLAPCELFLKHKTDGNKSGRAPVNHTAIHHRGRAFRVNDPFTVGVALCAVLRDGWSAGGAPRRRKAGLGNPGAPGKAKIRARHQRARRGPDLRS